MRFLEYYSVKADYIRQIIHSTASWAKPRLPTAACEAVHGVGSRHRRRPGTAAMAAAAGQFDWPVAVAATTMTEAAV